MSELGEASRNRVIGRSVGRVGLELKYARVRPSALSVLGHARKRAHPRAHRKFEEPMPPCRNPHPKLRWLPFRTQVMASDGFGQGSLHLTQSPFPERNFGPSGIHDRLIWSRFRSSTRCPGATFGECSAVQEGGWYVCDPSRSC